MANRTFYFKSAAVPIILELLPKHMYSNLDFNEIVRDP